MTRKKQTIDIHEHENGHSLMECCVRFFAVYRNVLQMVLLPTGSDRGIVKVHRKTGDMKGAAAYEISV